MSTLYLHIPFCRSRCIYCDFFSSVDGSLRERYVAALCREVPLRADYLDDRRLSSIYFGGGTPSQLTPADFARLFAAVREHYSVMDDAEITVECNPDDVTATLLTALRSLGVNRISMGVQSFDDRALKFLNRRHTAARAVEAVALCRACGIDNVSIDLMYSLPNQTFDAWRSTLDQAVALGVDHISAYTLMYEESTALTRLLQEGKIAEQTEQDTIAQFHLLTERLGAAGFEHYEISNFCQPGRHSRHNSAYWDATPYIGLGASAHSFDGRSRHRNWADIAGYCRAIEQGRPDVESEELTFDERYNEYVFTALRTKKGLPLNRLEEGFGPGMLAYCLENAAVHLAAERLMLVDGCLSLTLDGIMVSDAVMSDLMRV